MKSRKITLFAPVLAVVVIILALTAAVIFVPQQLGLNVEARRAIAAISINPAQPDATPVNREIVAIVQPTPQIDAAEWYAAHGEELETHGVLIESSDGRRVLASHNADVAFNPASLVKLATTLVALRKLGSAYRFETKVYVDGEPDADGTLRGRIYVSSNDPIFGDAGAQFIAKELRTRGIKRIAGGIGIAPNFCFNFTDEPAEASSRLTQSLKLDEHNQRRQPRQSPRDARKHRKSKQDEPQASETIVQEPSGRLLFAFKSYQLRDVLLYMNAHSNNFIAEHIGAILGGAGEVEKYLRDDLKLPTDKTAISRTSGLEFNRLTPRNMLTVIRALTAEAKRQGLRLEDIMPVAGDVGTLRHRFIETPLAGAVVGKTGTLTQFDGGTANLAGIIHTKESGDIVFAIFDSGKTIWKNHQLEEALLTDVLTQKDQAAPAPITTPRDLLPPLAFQIETR